MTRAARAVWIPLALAGAAAGCGSASHPARTAPGLRPAGSARVPAATVPKATPTAALAPGDLGARILRPTQLRATRDGRVVARLGTRTAFGSPRILAVLRRRDGWLQVIAAERPNGRTGWIAERNATLLREPVRVRIDLSQRRLRVLRGHRVLASMTVGIGAPATPTPTGRFAVTDGLRTAAGSPYGCCVLALSGHQPHIAQGWTGGDRIAVHGTTSPASIGQASSRGCLRAATADLRRLLRLVTLGARVEIDP